MKISPNAANHFLLVFPNQTYTFQTLVNRKPGVTAYVERADLFDYLSADCVALQKEGHEIFWMINEGNGVTHEGKKTCRSQKSVTHFTSCYIDADNCALEKIESYLAKRKIKPTAIVESSPGKHHIYFRLKRTEKTKETLKLFQETQLALCYFSNPKMHETGCDPSMRDWSRVLRVPGFLHLKAEPFQTKVKLCNKDVRYTLSDLHRLVNGEGFEAKEKGAKYEAPKGVIETGRHTDFTAFFGTLLNHGVDKDFALEAFYCHAKAHYKNSADFLPNGKRHAEVIEFINWKLGRFEEEDKKALLAKLDDSPKKDPFALPESFYFDCPGIVGDIVREVTKKAYFPSAPFAFASAIGAIGALKAPFTRSSMGHAPANYFLCLGHSGSGKNYIQDVLSHTFSKLGIVKVLENRLRSDRGLYRAILESGMSLLCMTDEISNLLEALSDPRAPHYIKSIKSALLELYSKNNTPFYSTGVSGNQKETGMMLRRPCLNLLGFSTLPTLEKAFTHASIGEGLLQRFLVITDLRPLKRNDAYAPATSLNSNVFLEMERLNRRSSMHEDTKLLELRDLKAEIQAEKDPRVKKELTKELEKLSEELTTPETKVIEFTPKAKKLFDAYADKLIGVRNSLVDAPHVGLYTRAAEQVGRLATAIATNQITDRLVDYLTEFVDSRINALVDYSAEYLDQTPLTRNAGILENKIMREYLRTGEAVPYRVLANTLHSKYRAELKDCLDILLDREAIREIKGRKEGSRLFIPN